MEIPIIGKPELGPYPINMFYSQAAHKELNLPGLMGTPGLKDYLDPSHAFEVRGLKVMGSNLYTVIGDRVYAINNTPTATLLSGTLTGTTGPVCMEQDGTYLMIVEPEVEGYLYTVASGIITAIADPQFPTPSFLTWQDGYMIPTETDTGRFWIPTVYLPTDWNGTYYATAEATPDNVLSILSANKELLIFGSESIQFYYNSGNAAFPIEVIQGTTIQEGISAAHSVAKGDNTVFYLGMHGKVMRITGHAANPISSDIIAEEINNLSTFSDAIGFYYAQKGHGFYVLTFPIGDKTYVFDVSTGFPHKRRSYPVHPDGTEGRWRASCHALFNGKHIVGDWQNGKLYELDFDTYTDNSQTIRRYFDFPAIGNGKDRIRHNKLKLDYKTGVGLSYNPGPNLLKDPSFEISELPDWTIGNSADVDRHTDPNSGTYCLEINENGVADPYVYQSVDVDEGEQYEASVYVKQGTAVVWKMHIWDEQNSQYLATELGNATGSYVQQSAPLSIPVNCTSIRVILQHEAALSAGTTVLFDDVVFRKTSVPPQAMLQWSDDGGKTWSNELWTDLGKIGEYDKEVNFRRLGAPKRRIYRNTISNPVEVVITGAKLT